MTKELLVFGPPGCGKTHTLINVVKKHLDNNGTPEKVGFVSFSRKSVHEAKDRISETLSLKQIPWFRTLHSIGYRWLGMRDENMLTRYDFNKLGLKLGVAFDNGTATSIKDGMIPMSVKEGNKYLEIIARATMRKISLEEQFSDVANYNLHWNFLKKIDQEYTQYKQDNDKYDFTDMIKLFVNGGSAPELELLIVDEAQDLTPLQWDQVQLMKNFAGEVWYAGDDDQCIHRWNGVKVGNFINACEDRTILDKSYRVPKSVHSLANKISKKISYRQPKIWNPTEEEGSVQFDSDWRDIDIDQGSWTMMARTNRLVSDIAKSLRDEGYLFTHYNRPSINPELLEGMQIWKTLITDEPLPLSEIKKIYKLMPKQGNNAMVKRGAIKHLNMLEGELFLSFSELKQDYGLLAEKDTSVYLVLNISKDDILYIRSIQRRGEILQKPRINISTIHAMKGGEDDNVVLLTESTPAAVNDDEQQDDEHRVFYTGVTRTRKNLHIIDTESKFKYKI